MIALLLPIALLCSAIGFTVQWREQWVPAPPTSERLWRGIDPPPKTPWAFLRWLFHFLKNVSTEYVRADSEWWSKFLAFIILTQSIVIGILV
jgi:hypothetical protein